jgi:hypothetical protein
MLGHVKDSDVKVCLALDEVHDVEDLAEDWDSVPTS